MNNSQDNPDDDYAPYGIVAATATENAQSAQSQNAPQPIANSSHTAVQRPSVLAGHEAAMARSEAVLQAHRAQMADASRAQLIPPTQWNGAPVRAQSAAPQTALSRFPRPDTAPLPMEEHHTPKYGPRAPTAPPAGHLAHAHGRADSRVPLTQSVTASVRPRMATALAPAAQQVAHPADSPQVDPASDTAPNAAQARPLPAQTDHGPAGQNLSKNPLPIHAAVSQAVPMSVTEKSGYAPTASTASAAIPHASVAATHAAAGQRSGDVQVNLQTSQPPGPAVTTETQRYIAQPTGPTPPHGSHFATAASHYHTATGAAATSTHYTSQHGLPGAVTDGHSNVHGYPPYSENRVFLPDATSQFASGAHDYPSAHPRSGRHDADALAPGAAHYHPGLSSSIQQQPDPMRGLTPVPAFSQVGEAAVRSQLWYHAIQRTGGIPDKLIRMQVIELLNSIVDTISSYELAAIEDRLRAWAPLAARSVDAPEVRVRTPPACTETADANGQYNRPVFQPTPKQHGPSSHPEWLHQDGHQQAADAAASTHPHGDGARAGPQRPLAQVQAALSNLARNVELMRRSRSPRTAAHAHGGSGSPQPRTVNPQDTWLVPPGSVVAHHPPAGQQQELEYPDAVQDFDDGGPNTGHETQVPHTATSGAPAVAVHETAAAPAHATPAPVARPSSPQLPRAKYSDSTGKARSRGQAAAVRSDNPEEDGILDGMHPLISLNPRSRAAMRRKRSDEQADRIFEFFCRIRGEIVSFAHEIGEDPECFLREAVMGTGIAESFWNLFQQFYSMPTGQWHVRDEFDFRGQDRGDAWKTFKAENNYEHILLRFAYAFPDGVAIKTVAQMDKYFRAVREHLHDIQGHLAACYGLQVSFLIAGQNSTTDNGLMAADWAPLARGFLNMFKIPQDTFTRSYANFCQSRADLVEISELLGLPLERTLIDLEREPRLTDPAQYEGWELGAIWNDVINALLEAANPALPPMKNRPAECQFVAHIAVCDKNDLCIGNFPWAIPLPYTPGLYTDKGLLCWGKLEMNFVIQWLSMRDPDDPTRPHPLGPRLFFAGERTMPNSPLPTLRTTAVDFPDSPWHNRMLSYNMKDHLIIAPTLNELRSMRKISGVLTDVYKFKSIGPEPRPPGEGSSKPKAKRTTKQYRELLSDDEEGDEDRETELAVAESAHGTRYEAGGSDTSRPASPQLPPDASGAPAPSIAATTSILRQPSPPRRKRLMSIQFHYGPEPDAEDELAYWLPPSGTDIAGYPGGIPDDFEPMTVGDARELIAEGRKGELSSYKNRLTHARKATVRRLQKERRQALKQQADAEQAHDEDAIDIEESAPAKKKGGRKTKKGKHDTVPPADEQAELVVSTTTKRKKKKADAVAEAPAPTVSTRRATAASRSAAAVQPASTSAPGPARESVPAASPARKAAPAASASRLHTVRAAVESEAAPAASSTKRPRDDDEFESTFTAPHKTRRTGSQQSPSTPLRRNAQPESTGLTPRPQAAAAGSKAHDQHSATGLTPRRQPAQTGLMRLPQTGRTGLTPRPDRTAPSNTGLTPVPAERGRSASRSPTKRYVEVSLPSRAATPARAPSAPPADKRFTMEMMERPFGEPPQWLHLVPSHLQRQSVQTAFNRLRIDVKRQGRVLPEIYCKVIEDLASAWPDGVPIPPDLDDLYEIVSNRPPVNP